MKKNKNDTVTLGDVKTFWEEHPLLSYELPYEPGSQDFFKTYDRIREDVEFKYCFHLLRLSESRGKKVFDVGCGNGWILSQYAKNGAKVFGMDLTLRGVGISSERFKQSGVKCNLVNASAEEIPFADNSFDLVTSLGVIHHTPRTELCAKELIRVCKPGGRVLIAVYYENLLVRKWFYPLTLLGLKILGRKDLSSLSRQEFVNHYDGIDNPLGKQFDKKQAMGLLKGLEGLRCEVHYFPRRFVPVLDKLPFIDVIERFLDKYFGFLIYIEGVKP